MTFVLSNLKSQINEHHEKMYVKTVAMVHQKGVKKHIEGVHEKTRNSEHESLSSNTLLYVIIF